VIVGEAGSGKSALWGVLHARLSKNRPLALLSHAAGASPRAPSIDFMLRRWIEELSAELGVTTTLEDNAKDQEVENAFASLLGRVASKRRVLILVDALDQFETTNRGRFMTWLPKLWPENARLIATAIPGEATQALERLPGMRRLPLPQLDQDEARDIVSAICRRYHRVFEAEVVEALAGRIVAPGPAQGNALWLVLAAEALNLLDGDDFARARTEFAHLPQARRNAALMLAMIAAMPADIPGLYGQSFDHAAKLFGERTVWAFLGAIAVSRGGWRESDFRGFLPALTGEPWDELRFAQLRRSFRGQRRARGALAQWDFAHGQMREAFRQWAGKRALGEEKALHTVIADRLLAVAQDDPLHVSEAMVHLLASENYQRAASYYGGSSLSEAEIQGATRVLADAVISSATRSPATAAKEICCLLNSPVSSVRAAVGKRFLYWLTVIIEDFASLDARLIIYDSTKRGFEQLLRSEPENNAWSLDLSASHERLGRVLAAQRDLPSALTHYRSALGILYRLANAEPRNANRQHGLALCHVHIGDVLRAQGNLDEALKSFRMGLTIADQLAKADPSNTDWINNLATSHDRVGAILHLQGNLPEAQKSYRAAVTISERMAKADSGNSRLQLAQLPDLARQSCFVSDG